MRVHETLYDIRDYEALPEGFPAQLVEGLLVKDPPPRYGHQATTAVVRHTLASLVGPLRVPDHPVAVRIDDHNVFHPDIVVIAAPLPADVTYMGVPQLVVEHLSTSTRRRDRHVKTPLLLRHGVAEVWLIDDRERTIEIHTREGSRIHRGPDEATSVVLPGFALTPAAVFAALS